MKIINHRASEGKPRTAGQVLNRATSGAICFRASKRTWACLKKLVLRWETPSYGCLISSTGVPGTSQDQSRMRVNQMTRSTWQGSTVLSGNTVQSQDSAARSRADYSHSRRTHTSPQPAGICHHLQAQSQPALSGMRSRKVKSKQFEIIHFAKLDWDLQSPLLPEISHRNSRTFCGENHFVERVQIAMKKLQQSFFFFPRAFTLPISDSLLQNSFNMKWALAGAPLYFFILFMWKGCLYKLCFMLEEQFWCVLFCGTEKTWLHQNQLQNSCCLNRSRIYPKSQKEKIMAGNLRAEI